MPAPAAPPAPAPEKIVIPALAKISPNAEPSPAPAPAAPPVPTPAAPAVSDGDGIPTSITDPAKKTPAQFAKERQESKVTKIQGTLEEVQRQADDAKMELARLMTERDATTAQITAAEKARDEFKAEAERLRGEVANVNERYFKNNEAIFNPNDDEDTARATSAMFAALNDKMPTVITDTNGQEKRIFFEQLTRTPAIANAVEALVGHYGASRQTGDAKGIDRAITAVAQILGANVFVGDTEDQDRLISPSEPLYREIESALREAQPHFVAKHARLRTIQTDGPKLVAQRLTKKEAAIRTRMESQIYITDEDASKLLQADPTDSRGLFGAILNAAPHLRELVQSKLTAHATTFSRMREGIELPTLTKSDPVSIAEHRKLVDETNERINRAASAAVIGESVGPILASLIAERDAAVARAEAASLNTNPGQTKAGGEGAPGTHAIDTDIIK